MSQKLNKPSKKSKTLEKAFEDSEILEMRLQKELKLLRSELASVRKEKPTKQVLQETNKLESTIGTVLLDLAEEIPLAGKAIKWFRSWMKG